MTYEELKNLVLKHNKLYYDLHNPEIEDKEWDQLYDNLVALEKAQGWKDYDSPTVTVGGSAGKVSHPVSLYSLRKVYDEQEIDVSFTIKTPKIDGSNLTLVYKNSKLKIAITRGDGERGEDVTHLAREITNIPKRIESEIDYIVINGECVTDNDVDNYRNYVSGALGLKSAEEFKERNIKFIAHDWLNIELDYTARMKIVKNMGFYTVFDKSAWDYPKDGVVYRIDSYTKSKNLGYTAKYPRFAVALKERELKTAITSIQEVTWAVGRTGTVNPIAVVDPVVLDDATISKVTLHNLKTIEDHNLGLGDLIQIERAGGVIPKFLRVIEHSKHGLKIDKKHAENSINAMTIRNGPKLFIADKSSLNPTKSLEHFIKTIGIKGLGPAYIKKANLVYIADLYKPRDWSILGANGYKIQEEIERSKTKPYELVLAALGIPGVGKSAAKLIVSKISHFKNLRDVELVDITGIGPATINSILNWLDANEEWVNALPLQLHQELRVNDITTNKGSKKVCITGRLDMTRDQLAEILTDKGYRVTSAVTKDCYALITAGDKTSAKYKKASEQDTIIIDYWSRKKEVIAGNF